MNLILGFVFGMLAQIATFYQLQGQFKYSWMKEHTWVVVLAGIPISYLYMLAVEYMRLHYDGQLWPGRLIGFAVGAVVFSAMSQLLFKEPLTTKTLLCLGLSLCILLVQIFWK